MDNNTFEGGEIALNVVPIAFHVGAGEAVVAQQDVALEISNATAWAATDDTKQAYLALPLRRITAGRLQDLYERGADRQAVDLLAKRHQLDLSSIIIQARDDTLVWTANRHFLDYMLAVPKEMGLWAVMPNARHLPGFTATFNFKHPFSEFSDSHGHLGFDPAGRMLKIGSSRREEMWLTWFPLEVMNGEESNDRPCKGPRSTRLSTPHFRMTMMFIAAVFVASMADKGLWVCPMEDLDEFPLESKIDWTTYTNVL
jgi:hypothetical protein